MALDMIFLISLCCCTKKLELEASDKSVRPRYVGRGTVLGTKRPQTESLGVDLGNVTARRSNNIVLQNISIASDPKVQGPGVNET